MQLTFATEIGETYAIEIDENMELENVMALLELEVSSDSRYTSLRTTPVDDSRLCRYYRDFREHNRSFNIFSIAHLADTGRSPESRWLNRASHTKEETFQIRKPP